LIINATSFGLQGKCVELPAHLFRDACVYDMQYGIEMKTPFLNYAKTNGAIKYQDGLGMLVGQAAVSFQLWEGIMPEVEPVLRQLKAEMSK
jgi:shikimate dehydrogenase